MRLNNASHLEGKFKLQVYSTETGKSRVLDWQDNTVLNQILSSSVFKAGQYVYCLFGTGNTAPAATQTTLANPLTTNYYIRGPRYGANSKVNCTRVGDIHSKEVTFYIPGLQGAVQGNVSELGLASGTSQNSLFTRALIKDELGNPTTLSLGPNDILTVWYTVTLITDCSVSVLATKQFTFNSQTITATLRLINQDVAPVETSQYGLLDYCLIPTGTNNAVNVTTNNLFYPPARYVSIAGGAIADYRAIVVNEVTLTSSGTTFRTMVTDTTEANGIGIKHSMSAGSGEFLAGSYTGEWRYLFLHTEAATLLNSQVKMNRCNLMIEFSPPLVKAAADKFTFDTLEFLHGVSPV